MLCLVLNPEAKILGAPEDEFFGNLGLDFTNLIIDLIDRSHITIIYSESLLQLVIESVIAGILSEHDRSFIF